MKIIFIIKCISLQILQDCFHHQITNKSCIISTLNGSSIIRWHLQIRVNYSQHNNYFAATCWLEWWYFNAYILWLNDFWRAQFGSLILMEKLLSMSLVTNPMIEWLRYETQQQWNCVFLSINQSNAINLSIKKSNEISLYIFCSYFHLNYQIVALSIHLRL